jgi:hypothetical protein
MLLRLLAALAPRFPIAATADEHPEGRRPGPGEHGPASMIVATPKFVPPRRSRKLGRPNGCDIQRV